MKRVISIAMIALLAIGLLAGCAKVPQEKLDEVRNKHQQLEDAYTRLGEVIDELDSYGMGAVPPSLRDDYEQLGEDLASNKEIIDTQLEKMKEEEVDEVIAQLDTDLADVDSYMPALESMMETLSYIMGISETMMEKNAQLENLIMQYSTDGVTPSDEVQQAYDDYNMMMTDYAANLNGIEQEMDEEDPESMIAAFESLKSMVDSMSTATDELIALMEADLGE